MATTLKTLRQAVGWDLNELFVGTVSTASGSSVACSNLIDIDADPSMYDRAWVRRFWVDGGSGELVDETRRVRVTNTESTVRGYDPTTGSIIVTRSWSTTPQLGDEFELHTLLDPQEMDRLITTGLQRCHYEYHQRIDVVSGQTAYDLASYTWLTRIEQVCDLELVTGVGEANEERSQAVTWFNIAKEATGLKLYVQGLSADSDDELRLVCIRHYGDTAWTDAGTECPLDWANAAAKVEIYLWLARRGPAEDSKRWNNTCAREAARYGALTRKYGPRTPVRIRLGDSNA